MSVQLLLCSKAPGSAGLGDDFQMQPLAVNGSYLVHSAIVAVQEIASVGNRTRVKWTDVTLRPTSCAHPSAVLTNLRGRVDAVLNLILNTGRSGGDQPSASFNLRLAHSF